MAIAMFVDRNSKPLDSADFLCLSLNVEALNINGGFQYCKYRREIYYWVSLWWPNGIAVGLNVSMQLERELFL